MKLSRITLRSIGARKKQSTGSRVFTYAPESDDSRGSQPIAGNPSLHIFLQLRRFTIHVVEPDRLAIFLI